ncbi:hypothetical protein GLYMA_19G253400v4 [Glycine max]|uniref:Uncharacterized protein n=1 Tax=Glycine max TaxID=3847 RepID=A0A0R0F3R7_SOYBN|nr:hypothetical protein GYH30_054200 [Glycine max]KRG97130.1 hypothetical protein GLYMA_19G253400v4 [Glycine max]
MGTRINILLRAQRDRDGDHTPCPEENTINRKNTLSLISAARSWRGAVQSRHSGGGQWQVLLQWKHHHEA